MKFKLLLPGIILLACNANEPKNTATKKDTPNVGVENNQQTQGHKADTVIPPVKTYFNKRFRDVTVVSLEENSYRVSGLGQIFEANFNWIVEDGHEELMKGYQMTDAGAPEWGRFDFTINVQKKRENSTLTLVLFESSAMDGSRQHELPIVLY